MTRVTAGVLAAWLLLPGLAAAQAQPAAAEPQRRPQLNEDIEILRRLLNSRLENEYAPVRQGGLTWAWTNCASCHDTGTAHWQILQDDSRSLSPKPNANAPRQSFLTLSDGASANWLLPADHAQNFALAHDTLVPLNHLHAAGHLDTEGVYLRGQGVVYTVTLPPPGRGKAEPRPAPAKPVSEWDRVRRELRGEKPEPGKQEPARKPTLTEIILRVLAENGRHFTELSPNESLTVVVTFRGGDPPPAPAAGATKAPPGAAGNGTATFTQELSEWMAREGAGQDYELLGDLHQKQGKTAEAIQAYQQALKQHPDWKRSAALFRKLAQALLSEGKDEEARELLTKALAERKKEPAAPPAETKRSPLPAKLIVTVPKGLLDAVASGRMNLDDFQKAARVEQVNPTAEP